MSSSPAQSLSLVGNQESLKQFQYDQWQLDHELATHTLLVVKHFLITTQSDHIGVD